MKHDGGTSGVSEGRCTCMWHQQECVLRWEDESDERWVAEWHGKTSLWNVWCACVKDIMMLFLRYPHLCVCISGYRHICMRRWWWWWWQWGEWHWVWVNEWMTEQQANDTTCWVGPLGLTGPRPRRCPEFAAAPRQSQTWVRPATPM